MLLILREELVCTVILVFLILYYIINKVQDKESSFLWIACFALSHVVFDIVTILTVNNRDVVPEFINRLAHVLFYASGILFALSFFQYVLHLLSFREHLHLVKQLSMIPFLLFLVLLIFLPMEYVDTPAASYSFGPLAVIGYVIFLIYSISSLNLLLIYRIRLDRKARIALLPMICLMVLVVILQAIFPLLLMTGALVTFVCLGLFVALDNPDKGLKEQALWDSLTGLKNRNSYNRDLPNFVFRAKTRRSSIGFVLADLNNLKLTNDTYGHVEGDHLISEAATILQYCLASAACLYRIGGDEFVAVYLAPNDAVIAEEIRSVREVCAAATDHPFPIVIALGYASGAAGDSVSPIFDEADRLMYENKAALKRAASDFDPDRKEAPL